MPIKNHKKGPGRRMKISRRARRIASRTIGDLKARPRTVRQTDVLKRMGWQHIRVIPRRGMITGHARVDGREISITVRYRGQEISYITVTCERTGKDRSISHVVRPKEASEILADGAPR